jgi:hypothetical protein
MQFDQSVVLEEVVPVKSLAPWSPLHGVSVFCCVLQLWNNCSLNAKLRPASMRLVVEMMRYVSDPIKHCSLYAVGRTVLSS